MGLFRSLTERSWLSPGEVEDEATYEAAQARTPNVALGVFLAVITVVFFLSWVAYRTRMEMNGFASDWQPLKEPMILWWNTALLVAASVAMHLARRAVAHQSAPGLKLMLWLAGALTLGFLLGQWQAWQQLEAAGHYAALNPANGFFYLLTALHGAHLVGGLVVWAYTLWRQRRGATPDDLATAVRLTTVYWDYLLLVWLGLFALLLST